MGANARKPEEQATAVLAAALYTSRLFRERLLAPLESKEILDLSELANAAAIDVYTEVGTPTDDLVDLELQLNGATGALERRVWIEVKVDALLASARDGKKPQLPRYRDALTQLERRAPGIRRSVLAVLVRRADERREWPPDHPGPCGGPVLAGRR